MVKTAPTITTDHPAHSAEGHGFDGEFGTEYCALVAPMAFLTPISRVRSVTETSMMFMTPTPPTIKPMLATPIIKMKMPPVSWFQILGKSLPG